MNKKQNNDFIRAMLEIAVYERASEPDVLEFLESIARRWAPGHEAPSDWVTAITFEMDQDAECVDCFSIQVLSEAFNALRGPTGEPAYPPHPSQFLEECKRQHYRFAEQLRAMNE
jgi:hypothetical protein